MGKPNKEQNNKKEKSFTLIETLIVIAIIGILAFIIAVAANNVREKARISAGLQFSSSIKNAVGVELVGEWSFNENADDTCQGAVSPYDDICDSSGNNNHGQRFGASWVSGGDNTPSGTGYALSFNGTSNYVNAGTGSSLKINNKSFTLEAWIKPTTNIPASTRYEIIATFNPGWMMDLSDDGNIEGYRFYNSTTGAYKYIPPGNLISLKWTHFVVTRNLTTQQLSIYLNGGSKQTWSIITVADSTNPLLIGKHSSGMYFNGLIDEVRIYEQALTSVQIEKLYAEGAKKRGLLVKE